MTDQDKTKEQLISELRELRRKIADLECLERDFSADLREEPSESKAPKGRIPVCAWCRKIRGDNDFWHNFELFIEEHSHLKFTHGICPECQRKEDIRLAEMEAYYRFGQRR